MHVELVRACCFDGRQDPRQVFGLASGHHRSDGDLLDGDVHEVGRHGRNDVARRSRRTRQHAHHPLLGGRHDGQAVGPSAGEHHLHLVFGLGHVDATRRKDRRPEPDVEGIDQIRIDTHRTAPRPHRGEIRPQPRDSGDTLPLLAMPADRAFDLDAVDDTNDGGHGLDGVMPADGEVLIVHRGDVAGEIRVILCVDGQGCGAVELHENRADRMAGGALLLDHDDDPVGEYWSVERVCHGPTVATGEGVRRRSPRPSLRGDVPNDLSCGHRGFTEFRCWIRRHEGHLPRCPWVDSVPW